MLNLVALHGRDLKLPKGWDTSEPGCWMKREKNLFSDPIRWFNSEDEALEFAASLDWWLLREAFPGLWRVEEMDGYR